MRLPLPLGFVAAMLVLGFAIELALAGRVLVAPALPLVALLALAAARPGRR
jgi:hypothetical protein